MEQQQRICPECSRMISPDDTIEFALGCVSHLDCQRPRVLGIEERSLLYRYCWAHAVARCEPCAKQYRSSELAADLFSGKEQLCPRCRADLTESVRTHLYNCTMLPEEVRRGAREARETAQRLVKQNHQLGDSAELLMREAEAAIQALRTTMRATTQNGAP
jgi:hypothetical protein